MCLSGGGAADLLGKLLQFKNEKQSGSVSSGI